MYRFQADEGPPYPSLLLKTGHGSRVLGNFMPQEIRHFTILKIGRTFKLISKALLSPFGNYLKHTK